MSKKDFSSDFLRTVRAIKETNKFNQAQLVIFDLLMSMVKAKDISECQACYTLGIMVAKGEAGIKDYVESQRQKIKEEVKNNG